MTLAPEGARVLPAKTTTQSAVAIELPSGRNQTTVAVNGQEGVRCADDGMTSCRWICRCP
jgi:hypothetical protein